MRTLSVALPGSIISNRQSLELASVLAGQIARALSIFNVHEVVVFSEDGKSIEDTQQFDSKTDGKYASNRSANPNVFLARLLEYLETPQYLRKMLFPHHPDLRYVGLVMPLDAPHHLREDEEFPFREGAVISSDPQNGSLVEIGLKKKARISQCVPKNTRLTLRLTELADQGQKKKRKKHHHGSDIAAVPVDSQVPCIEGNRYWGYQVRIAAGINEALTQSIFGDPYDLIIGTSDKGDNAFEKMSSLPDYKRLMIVFGGVMGLETCIEQDDKIKKKDAQSLFSCYLNTCPNQGARTIRTEEAILITLATLQPFINRDS